MKTLPTITISMPTFNSEPRLEKCLSLIRKTDYPQNKIEIIIADGGSTDNTLQIAKKYNCKIFNNPRKLPEPGKAIGIKNAHGSLICFIDDDNFITDKDFFKKMVEPFNDKEIIASEPWEYTLSNELKPLEQYWAIMGLNDPTMYYIGCYDRLNKITKTWTNLKIKTEDKKTYLKIFLEFNNLPTIGANGFMVRTKIIKKIDYENLLDLDKVAALVKANYHIFAKVKCGLIHTFCPDLKSYVAKCQRKANSYYGEVGYKGQKEIENIKRLYKYPNFEIGIIKFSIYSLLIIPIIIFTLNLFNKSKNINSLYNIPLTYITFFIYAKKTIFRK